MDIAPLGFAVDTSGLDSVAEKSTLAAAGLNKVADATDHAAAKAKTATGGLNDMARAMGVPAVSATTLSTAVNETVKAMTAATAAHAAHATILDRHTLATANNTKAVADQQNAVSNSVSTSAVVVQHHVEQAKAIDAHTAAVSNNARAHREFVVQMGSGLTPATAIKPQVGKVVTVTEALGKQDEFFNTTKPKPSKFDIEKMEVERKALEKHTAEIVKLDASLDPTAAKIGKMNLIIQKSGQLFDSGAISAAKYHEILDKAGAKIDELEKGGSKAGAAGPQHISEALSIAEIAEKAAQRRGGVFGQVLKGGLSGAKNSGFLSSVLGGQAAGEGEGAGAGIMGLVGGAAAGGIGFLAAGLVQKTIAEVKELFNALKEAGQEAESMERHFEALGGTNAKATIEALRNSATEAGIAFRSFADEVVGLDEKFTRFHSNRDQNVKLVEAIHMAASNAGVDGKGASEAEQHITGLADKLRVSSADISATAGLIPGSGDLIAKYLGVTGGENGLKAMAAAGKLDGEAYIKAWLKAKGEIEAEHNKKGDTLEEANNKAENASNHLKESIAKATSYVEFLKGARSVDAVFDNWLAEAIGGGAASKKETGSEEHARRVKQVRDKASGKTASDALDAENAHNDTKYGSYAGELDSRKDALRQLQEAETQIAHLRAAGKLDDKKQGYLDYLVSVIPEMKRAAEGSIDPFRRLTKEVSSFGEAMSAGGGGAVALWKEANSMAEQQVRHAGDALKSAKEFYDLIVLRKKLESEQEVGSRMRQADIQGALANSLVAGGPGGDALRPQADAEAATWAFQQFGDAVSKNDELVKRYADSLYALKLAMRDVSDANEANSIKTNLAGIEAKEAALRAGKSLSQAEYEGEKAKIELKGQARNSSGYDAYKGGSYTVQGIAAPGGGVAVAAGGVAGAAGGVAGGGGLDAGVYAGERSQDWQVSSKGARSRHQVLPSTAHKPGYGVRPAADESLGEYNRVGHDLIGAYTAHYGGDQAAGFAAYNAGPRTIDKLRREHGSDWQRFLHKDVRQYVGRAMGATGGVADDNMELGVPTRTVNIPGYAGRKSGMSDVGGDATTAERLQLDTTTDDKLIVSAFNANQKAEDTKALFGAARSGDPRKMRDAQLAKSVSDINDSAGTDSVKKSAVEATQLLDQTERQLDALKEIGRLRSDQSKLESERDLIRYGGDELKVQEAILREKNTLIQQGIDLTSKEAKEALKLAEINSRKNIKDDAEVKRIKTVRDGWDEAAQGIGKSLEDAFNTAFTAGKGMGQVFLQGIGDAGLKLLDRLLQAAVINPLVSAIGNIGQSVIGSLFHAGGGSWSPSSDPLPTVGSGTRAARGEVFGSRGLQPFALGGLGLFNTPTHVAMANGGTALIGEAGPEAVMPLRRGPDGKLGVAGSGSGGGGVNVQIIDQRTSAGSHPVEVQERSTGNGMRDLQVMVRDAVRADMRKGSFDVDQRTQFGVGRAVPRR